MASFLFQCPVCKQKLNADTDWIGQSASCPFCGNYVQISKKQTISPVLIVVFAAAVSFILICLMIAGTVVDALDAVDFSSSDSEESFSSYESCNPNHIYAKQYIDSLPAGQHNAILHGGGSEEDRANAMANLRKSGNMKEVADYLQDN